MNASRQRRWWHPRVSRAGVAAAVAALVVLSAQPSLADPAGGETIGPAAPIDDPTYDPAPAGFASWQEVLTTQYHLNEIAVRLSDAVAGLRGYAGISVPTEEGRVVVRWQGAPPPEAVEAVDRERGSAVLRPAVYSTRDLGTAIDQVLALAQAEGAPISAADPVADGSGITVFTTGPIAIAQDLVSRATPVAATVEPGSSVPAFDRLADASPYWGGARWRTWAGSCTSGFAVHRIQDGHDFLISAGHCADDGDDAYTGASAYMGRVVGDDDMHDTLLIDATSEGRMYQGLYTTADSVPIAPKAMQSFPGNYVCASGSYSGTTCYSKVISVGGAINIGYTVKPTVRAEQLSHTAAVGNGDSGGPVFFGGPYECCSLPYMFNRNAMGTTTAIDAMFTAVPCEGVPTGGGRVCAWRWWYIDITGPLSYYGLAMN